jgi:hypothetical protein
MIDYPDLSLASTYIPACWCVIKSIACIIMFLLLPSREYPVLVVLLVLDRILTPHKNVILDINAICFTMVMGVIVNEMRRTHTFSLYWLECTIFCLWSIFTLSQTMRIISIQYPYEIAYAALCVPVLMHVFIDAETYEITCLRVVCFVFCNIYTNYMLIYYGDMPSVFALIIGRTMIVLFLNVPFMLLWTVVYLAILTLSLRYYSNRCDHGHSRHTSSAYYSKQNEPVTVVHVNDGTFINNYSNNVSISSTVMDPLNKSGGVSDCSSDIQLLREAMMKHKFAKP